MGKLDVELWTGDIFNETADPDTATVEGVNATVITPIFCYLKRGAGPRDQAFSPSHP